MTTNNWATLLLANLRVGSVVYTHCDFCTPPKNKFLLVVSLDPKCLVLVINSEINQFYINNGSDKYHVLIPESDHDFLEYDSYANCIDSQSAFETDGFQNEMLNNYNNFHKGWLTDDCLLEVYNAVSEQTVMRRGHKREIMASLEKQLQLSSST